MPSSLRIRVEDEIDNASLPQSVVTFGVMTDKLFALSGDPALTQTQQHLHLHLQSNNIARQFDDLIASLQSKTAQPSPPALTDETEQRVSPGA